MKKLIPMFLASAFMLTGSNVFANNLAENAEFVETTITLKTLDVNDEERFMSRWTQFGFDESNIVTSLLRSNENLLRVQMPDNDDVVYFIPYAEIARLLTEVAQNDRWRSSENHGLHVNWVSETNTIEFFDGWFLEHQESEVQVVDPIDMDTINLDEWISIEFIFQPRESNEDEAASSRSFGGSWGSDSVNISLWDSYNNTSETVFESVVGCNTVDIRAINVHLETQDLADPFQQFNIKFNLQDMIDSETFARDEVENWIKLRDTYGTPEKLRGARSFEGNKELIESGVLSNDQLYELINAISSTLGERSSNIN